MKESETQLAERLVLRNSTLKAERSAFDGFWRECARYVSPRKAAHFNSSDVPDVNSDTELFDTTAIRANAVLANGQMTYTTPVGQRWFSFDAPPALKGNDKAESWFSACTEIIQLGLARSNFYTEIHELYFDRSGFGTAVLFAEAGRTNPFRFESFPVGSFSLSESDEGLVDTIFREFELTARQAKQKFGEDKLPQKIKDALAQKDGRGLDTKFTFIHCIYPREDDDREQGKIDGPNMPIASVYVEVSCKHAVEISGYPEMPAFATRFQKWGRSPYGWSPSWTALPDAKQKNFLEKNLDALAEVKAWPRLLVPETLEGEIELSAGGQTFYNPTDPGAKPQAWATEGDYPIGVDRSDRKRDAIEKAFYVDVFQMFDRLDKNMTAREVAAREAEKLVNFSPTFSRMTTELFNPLLLRAFRIAARQGMLPPPPKEILIPGPNGASVPEPQISYSSRIALAIKALENQSFTRMLDFMAPILPMRPEILDNLNIDTIIRDMARNDGMPDRWMLDEETRDAIRGQRAQQAQELQQAQQAQAMADSAAKLGGIPKDSAVLKALGNAA